MNKQKWEKLGPVFVPAGTPDWLSGFAAVPFLQRAGDDHVRIYFSSRDPDDRSHVGWVVIDMNDPLRVVEVSPGPVLAPGPLGHFDEDGAMGCELVEVDGCLYMYYIGWNAASRVPFRNAIGLAVSADGGATFERYSPGPIMDRSIHDPCFVASHCVLFDKGLYKMWYLSCIAWDLTNGAPRHRYHIKYAESRDGIDWVRDGTVAIDFAYPNEYAISVPRVITEDGVYRMWYSYRGGPKSDFYRIGFAESSDGKTFTRLDDTVDLEPTPGDWDGDMVCYPFVFDWDGNRYLLYNGDGYGRTGFGIAIQADTALNRALRL